MDRQRQTDLLDQLRVGDAAGAVPQDPRDHQDLVGIEPVVEHGYQRLDIHLPF